MTRLKFLSLAILIAVGFSQTASAAQRQFLGGYKDWDAFVEKTDKGETVCYMISVPKSTAPQNVNRGEIYLMVTRWAKTNITNQVSVIVGYPLKDGSTPTVAVDNKTYKMFVDGDRAWAWDAQQDNEMTVAMKRGSKLVVKGVSKRGTNTTDSYSLAGFTAANNAIAKACK